MKRNKVLRIWGLSLVVVLIFSMLSMPASAKDLSQEPTGEMQINTATSAAPVMEEAVDLAEPPALTEEQRETLEYWTENTHLPGPELSEQVGAFAAEPETEMTFEDTRARSGQPLLPGDPEIYLFTNFGSSIPGGFKSNVMESSMDGKARKQFYTGNWFAARSLNKGLNWTFISPYSGFPDFCCDQVMIHDMARDIYIWQRMGGPDGSGENVFKLSVDFKDPFLGAFTTYTFAPTDVDVSWTNQWWDYPHMQLGADYLYLTWNMFDWNGTGWTTDDDFWVRSVMLRLDLNDLAAGGAVSYGWMEDTEWFTFVPVSGSPHTAYWASNWPNTQPQNNRLKIWRLDEDSGTFFWWIKTITSWSPTGRCDPDDPSKPCMQCGNPNWLARGDMRVLTGARHTIMANDLKIYGRKILSWWWNVKEGGTFALPYIDGAAFYEDTMTQVAGNQGRPLIFNPELCFAYPSVAPNVRQDLGVVFNWAGTTDYHKPKSGYFIRDDYNQAAPGGTFYGIAASKAGPSDEKWGDYNTVRAAHGPAIAWSAGVHVISASTVNCTNCASPIAIFFGRERDKKSWQMW